MSISSVVVVVVIVVVVVVVVVVVLVVVVVIIVVVVVLPWSSCRVVGCVGSVDGVEGGGALSMGVWH